METKSTAFQIMTALHRPENFDGAGKIKPEVQKGVIDAILKNGVSDNELAGAAEVLKHLRGTPHADFAAQIADAIEKGYRGQNRFQEIWANLQDRPAGQIASSEWMAAIHPTDAAKQAGWEKTIGDMQHTLAAAVHGGQVQRGFHAAQLFGELALVTVYNDAPIPPEAKVGLFGKGGSYVTAARGSNGSPCPYMIKDGKREEIKDKEGDVRGLALTIIGPGGKLDNITSTNQTHGQHVKNAGDFVDVFTKAFAAVLAEGHHGGLSELELAARMIRESPLEGPKIVARLARDTRHTPESIATEDFVGSVVRLGTKLAKVVFIHDPTAPEGTMGDKNGAHHLVEDAEKRGPKKWLMCLQFYTNEKDTSLTDATEPWGSPLIPVGEVVTCPPGTAAERKAEAEIVSQLSFNPKQWDGGPIPAEMPAWAKDNPLVGDMNAPRGAIYELSAKNRGAKSAAESVEFLGGYTVDALKARLRGQ